MKIKKSNVKNVIIRVHFFTATIEFYYLRGKQYE